MGFSPIKTLLSKVVGFEDGSTAHQHQSAADPKRPGPPLATPQSLAALSAEQKSRCLCAGAGCLTSYFEPKVVIDSACCCKIRLLSAAMRPIANGKPLHRTRLFARI